MAMTMRALLWDGDKDIQVDNIPIPELKSGCVKVKNVWSGICGSDLHVYAYQDPKYLPINEPHPLTGDKTPTVIGHEFVGVISELGQGVNGLSIGQKVAIFPIISDGTCHYCKTDQVGFCDNLGFLGYSGIGGGMAQYICVDRKEIYPIPEHVPLDVAALVEPLAVAWHGVKLSRPKPTDTVLVLGAGPVGMAAIFCLRALGVSTIIVSELSPTRKKIAKDAGATFVLDPRTQDVVAFCHKTCDGLGVHIAFECAGAQASMDAAIGAIRGKGVIIGVAMFEKEITMQPNLYNAKSAVYKASNVYTRKEFQEVIDMVASGKLENIEIMITAKVPLSNAVDGGFKALIEEKDKHVKVLIDPQT